ncbi:Rid family hydrolase [Mesorhizobium sp. B2-4-6]|uniref:Rid family hydrolase n=1 Tax=Mesorhizobium sp. B2-4-6 TaxID=2589943 RepID=UPI001FEFFA39|nr:Rid family hydrolase [Mesorhizobium sp. B2-4-6]
MGSITQREAGIFMRNRIFSGAASEAIAGYAKAVIDGRTIHVSGTTGRDPVTNEFPEDPAQQARNALSSINDTLRQAGSSLADAVVSRVFVADAEAASAVVPVLGEVFGDIRPTSTFLICQIPASGARVEIEITASRSGSVVPG